MPQSPFQTTIVGPVDFTTAPGATASVLNITAATVVKASASAGLQVIVNTAGSTVGSVSDTTTVGAVAAANLVFSIPNVVGLYALTFPFHSGIVVTPGTGQVLSVSYS
jgi:hypothetical protein